MKRLFSYMISAVVFAAVCFCVSFSSFAAPSQVTDIEKTQLGSSKTYYSFNAASKTLTISGEGSMPNFSTSQSMSDAQPWYDWRKDGSIEHIVVEEGVTSLGNYCFYSVSVGDITLPSTLKTIGSYSLANNPVIEAIDFKNVTSIANYACYMCYGLKDVNIPSTVKSIGKFVFADCRALSKVTFENQYMTITIDEKAFFKCPELKEITVPFNAKLKNYAVGFTDGEKVGTVACYDDFIMNLYMDSSAYDYAKKYSAYSMNFNTLDEMIIYQGADVERKFFSDNLNEKMVFSFTAEQSASYSFCLTGSIKAECVLTDSKGKILKQFTYNPIIDDECNIDFDFIEGNTYYYTISSMNTMGDFKISLMPSDIEKIEIDWDFSFKAADLTDGKLDIERLIKGLDILFIYASGFVYSLPYSDGAEYNDMKVSYSNKLNSKVTCGENTDCIMVGDLELPFTITVEHSYIAQVVEPTIKNGGYTSHTCVLCGDQYTSDFTEPLGRTVYGHVKIMSSPNGDVLENSYMSGMLIYNNHNELIAITDENGFFTVEYAYDYIVIENYAGPDRKIMIDSSSGNLGDIGLVYCDFNCDDYINAKDFALINSMFGEYDCSEEYYNEDVNKDGVIDINDWSYASSYFTYGKLDESIYN